MSDIGLHKTTKAFDLGHEGPDGLSIPVDVEISGVVYCDNPEWGIEARDVTARIVSRELTDEEVDGLSLDDVLSEDFYDSQPAIPRPNSYYRCHQDGLVWRVIDTLLTWGTDRDRYVLIERVDYKLDLRPISSMRRLVPLDEFYYGANAEGESLFTWTTNEPETSGTTLKPTGGP